MNTQMKRLQDPAQQSRLRPRHAIVIGGLAALALTGGVIAVAGYGDNSSPAASSTTMSEAQPNTVTVAGDPFILSAPVTGRHSEFGVAAFEGAPIETSPPPVALVRSPRALPAIGVAASEVVFVAARRRSPQAAIVRTSSKSHAQPRQPRIAHQLRCAAVLLLQS